MNNSTKSSHLGNPQISINSSRPSSPRIWSRSAAAVQEEERTQCAPRRKRGTFQFPCCSFLPRFYPEPRSTLLCRRLKVNAISGDGGGFSSRNDYQGWSKTELEAPGNREGKTPPLRYIISESYLQLTSFSFRGKCLNSSFLQSAKRGGGRFLQTFQPSIYIQSRIWSSSLLSS